MSLYKVHATDLNTTCGYPTSSSVELIVLAAHWRWLTNKHTGVKKLEHTEITFT